MRLMEQFGQRKYNEGEQNGEKRGSETSRQEIAENTIKRRITS